MEEYNANYKDAIDRGAMIEVTNEEIKAWKEKGNKVHYTGHHPVFKETSKTTPLHIVNDSALRNNCMALGKRRR